MGKVLVLGHDVRAFLSTVRSLGRAGHEVHAVQPPFAAAAMASRYLRRLHPRLERLEDYDLVLPCEDSWNERLQRTRPAGNLYLQPAETFRLFSSKEETTALAARLGIPVPRSRRLEAPEDALDFELPVVLKPVLPYAAQVPVGGGHPRREVAVVRRREEVRSTLEAMLREGPVLAQEYHPGQGVGVEILAWEGEPLLVFQHQRLHEPPDGGGSSYRGSQTPSPELLEAARALLRSVRYSGVAMVEFRRQGSAWVLLEVNARFWGSLPLALASGVDFPLALYQMWVEGRRSFAQPPFAPRYGRNLFADLDWLRANRPPLARLAGELGPFLRGRESWDSLAADDPAPFLAELRHFARKFADLYLRFPAWERRQARRAFARSRRVLVLCRGNICRSPFAGLFLQQRDPARQYRSAGFHPAVGRPSPALAVAAARRHGVELEAHRSCLVDREQMEWADLVLIFDRSNLADMRSHFPRRQCCFVGDLGSGATAIADPERGSESAFEACYAAIVAACEAVL